MSIVLAVRKQSLGIPLTFRSICATCSIGSIHGMSSKGESAMSKDYIDREALMKEIKTFSCKGCDSHGGVVCRACGG